MKEKLMELARYFEERAEEHEKDGKKSDSSFHFGRESAFRHAAAMLKIKIGHFGGGNV